MKYSQSKLKYVIIILALCGIMASSTGITFNSAGVFYGPVSTELGIKQGTFSFYQTLASITTAVLTLYTSKHYTQKNFKMYLFLGTVLTAASTGLMAVSKEIYQFYLLGIISGVGKAFYVGVFTNVIINNWFITHHGLVTGFVTAFTGVAGTIFSPIFSSIISTLGWQQGYVIMGVAIAVLNLLIVLYPFSLKPEDDGMKPYQKKEMKKKEATVKETIKVVECTPLLMACLMVFGFLVTGITTLPQHFPSYLVSLGYSSTLGASAVSLCLIGNIVSKVIFGILADRYGPKKIILLMLSVNFASMGLLLIHSNVFLILIGAFFFGSIYSISAVGLTLMIKERFGLDHFRYIFPKVTLLCNVGLALLVSMFGYVYNFARSYLPAFGIVAVFEAIIFIALTIVYKRKGESL